MKLKDWQELKGNLPNVPPTTRIKYLEELIEKEEDKEIRQQIEEEINKAKQLILEEPVRREQREEIPKPKESLDNIVIEESEKKETSNQKTMGEYLTKEVKYQTEEEKKISYLPKTVTDLNRLNSIKFTTTEMEKNLISEDSLNKLKKYKEI